MYNIFYYVKLIATQLNDSPVAAPPSTALVVCFHVFWKENDVVVTVTVCTSNT